MQRKAAYQTMIRGAMFVSGSNDPSVYLSVLNSTHFTTNAILFVEAPYVAPLNYK